MSIFGIGKGFLGTPNRDEGEPTPPAPVPEVKPEDLNYFAVIPAGYAPTTLHKHFFVFHMSGGGTKELEIEEFVEWEVFNVDLRDGRSFRDGEQVIPEVHKGVIRTLNKINGRSASSDLIYGSGQVRISGDDEMTKPWLVINKGLVEFTEYRREVLRTEEDLSTRLQSIKPLPHRYTPDNGMFLGGTGMITVTHDNGFFLNGVPVVGVGGGGGAGGGGGYNGGGGGFIRGNNR